MMNEHDRAGQALLIQRVALSGFIAAHGWARLLSDAVEPFGTWLDGLGFPFGIAIAVLITALEILGTPFLALGRFVTGLCVLYVAIYSAGIVLVHAPAGWFVVGLGRNGMEYSVLLIVCLLSNAYVHFPRPGSSAASE